MSNAMSLKAKIRNIAKQKSIPAQVILQNYMFERLLVRLSASEYREKFVLKGGMLVAAIPSAVIRSECKVYYIKPELFDLGIPAQVILQNYMFERLLVRLCVSKYGVWKTAFLY